MRIGRGKEKGCQLARAGSVGLGLGLTGGVADEISASASVSGDGFGGRSNSEDLHHWQARV